jgi:chromosome segregation ATPase
VLGELAAIDEAEAGLTRAFQDARAEADRRSRRISELRSARQSVADEVGRAERGKVALERKMLECRDYMDRIEQDDALVERSARAFSRLRRSRMDLAQGAMRERYEPVYPSLQDGAG